LGKKHSKPWQAFFEPPKRIEIPLDFLDERNDTLPLERSG